MDSMHATVVVPGSLVPAELAVELAASLVAPAMSRLLARSSVASESAAEPGLADTTWFAQSVYGEPPPPPTAPYAWAALAGAHDAEAQIWHADPVHVAIGRDSLIVLELTDAPDEAEANALMAAANECLLTAGLTLRRIGAHWFLHADRDWTMTPRPLAAALGLPLPAAAPDDGDTLRWSRLHNEIQMRWHVHAINAAREAQGRPVVNALWLHGGGKWRARPALRWPRVRSGRADLQGLAHAAGAAIEVSGTALTGDTLLVWDDAAAPARGSDWPRWLAAMQAIDQRLATLPPSATLELVMTGLRRIRVRTTHPSDRYRVWRRTSLAQALTE